MVQFTCFAQQRKYPVAWLMMMVVEISEKCILRS